MTSLSTASDNSTRAVVSDTGIQGLPGENGQNGDTVSGYIIFKNPIVSMFKNNVLIDAVSGSLSVSRATTSTLINQSNAIETVGINDPALGKGGVACYNSYTNYFPDPESPASQAITIPAGNYTLHVMGDGSATTTYGTAQDGSPVLFTSTGEALTVTISGSLSLCNIIDIYSVAPPIISVAAPATRGADNISIPMMGNIPAAGSPFTIIIDCKAPRSAAGEVGSKNILRTTAFTAAGGLTFYRVKENNNLAFGLVGAGGPNYITIPNFDGDLHRFVLKYDGSVMYLYIDGVMAGSSTAGEIMYDTSGSLFIGSVNGANCADADIKNLRIYKDALTDEQIESLGGPE